MKREITVVDERYPGCEGQKPRERTLSDMEAEVLRARAFALASQAVEECPTQTVASLLFAMGEETYGVRLSEVREIQRDYRLTPIPCVPDFVLGVMSMRGEIVSVNDLASMMGLSSGAARRPRQPAIVLEVGGVQAAIVVDEIRDIADIPVESIDPPLNMVGHAQAPFLNGTALVDGRLVGLIDARRVLEPVGGPSGPS